MPTIEEYEAAAPTVMSLGEFTAAQVENKLSTVPTEPAPQPAPDITKAKVVAIFNAVFAYSSVQKGIEASGGILQLAHDNDLTSDQVRLVIKELEAMNQVYLASL